MSAARDASFENILVAFNDRFGEFTGTIYSPMMPPYTDPLRFIGAQRVSDPLSHWHVVTVGFTEFAEKETANLERSGYGFELSLRLIIREDDGETPPAWIADFLQKLARIVFWSNEVPADNHWLRFDEPRPWGRDLGPIRVLVPRAGFGGVPSPLEFVSSGGPIRKMYDGMRRPRLGHDDPPPDGGALAWSNPFIDRVTGLVWFPEPALPTVATVNGHVRVLTALAVITESPLDAALAVRARARWPSGIIPRVFDELRID